MNRRKEIALVTAGILAGTIISGPATQAAAGLMASPSSQRFCLDGQKIAMEAYEINGSNYVKLRDVGQAIGFGVTYDAAANTVHIDPYTPYTEEVNATQSETSTLANGKPITEENVLELLRQLEKEWPEGTIWGTSKTPGTHKNEVPSTAAKKVMDVYRVSATYGCGGYAAMVSSLIFGDAENPARRQEDLSQIRPGDIVVRVNNKTGAVWHVTVALESPNKMNAFHITDGNCNSKVYWPDVTDPNSRDILDCYRGEYASNHLEVWTRYPENIPYTGSSVNAWPADK